jgi:hemerythrin superfamily protein
MSFTDPFTLLITDHRTVDALFDVLLKDTMFTEEKHRALNSLIRELCIHAEIEEMYLYPTIRRVMPNGNLNADKAITEHKHVKDILDCLDTYSGKVDSDPTLPYPYMEIKALQTEVTTHVKDEETRLFPTLKSLLTGKEQQELAEKLEAGKKMAPTRPHPMAPTQPPFNKIAGLGAAVVDKLRDTTREFVEQK